MKYTLTALFTLFSFVISAKDYYISASGNDNATGSIATPWKTLTKLNGSAYSFGDRIYLEGGATFVGSIAPKKAITGVEINSYGLGRAIVGGVKLTNPKNVTVKNLIVAGAGYMATSMTAYGVYLIASTTTSGTIIENVEAYGFGGFGIYAAGGGAGFDGLQIINCVVRENGLCGIKVMGAYTGKTISISNKNILVQGCKAYNNYGRSDYTGWSGSGILLQGCDASLIIDCEAYNNGRDNARTDGGPIGIWFDNCTNSTIKKCISHHNLGGKTRKDGGGFDLDGGCSYCIIEDCVSYENEGAGFGFFQWATTNPWRNNIIRNNTSTNDAKNGSYGVFTFWGVSSTNMVDGCDIYGNTITKSSGRVVTAFGSNQTNIRIHDNTFCLTGTATVGGGSGITISNNTNSCALLLSIRPQAAQDNIEQATFNLYPNPATSNVNISLNNTRNPTNLQIIDAVGRVMWQTGTSRNLKNVSVDISRYTPGVYFALLRNEYGVIVKKKLIKQ